MKNYAGDKDEALDVALKEELETAGFEILEMPESMRSKREVGTRIVGILHGWSLTRAWYYWVAEGPGIPVEEAVKLQESHGKQVRANGDCVARGPLFWNKGFPTTMYHIDTAEGLKAFADVVHGIKAKWAEATEAERAKHQD